MSQSYAKIVFAGPVGAGKTTAIRSLSDFEPVSTEMPLADGPMGDKTTTTVALDFSSVMLDDGTPLQLYGLPGQEHFAHMRALLLEGAIGVVIVLSGDSAAIEEECEHWIRSIHECSPGAPLVIGITKTEVAAGFRMDRMREVIERNASGTPLLTFDARSREQSTQLIRVLLLSIDEDMLA